VAAVLLALVVIVVGEQDMTAGRRLPHRHACPLVDVEQGLIHCTGTIRLADGQITFQGLTTTASTKQVAITGGTGRYQGVGGEATLVENPDQTGTLTVRLRR
jgi:hypothetical protein